MAEAATHCSHGYARREELRGVEVSEVVKTYTGRWTLLVVVKLAVCTEAKIVSGIDDDSRFIMSALVVERATARPTCDAPALAIRRFGVPAEILTDNSKVFTGRFGSGTGEVLFDPRVEVLCEQGLVHTHHQSVLVATHAGGHDPATQTASIYRGDISPRQRPKVKSPTAVAVTHNVDTTGRVPVILR